MKTIDKLHLLIIVPTLNSYEKLPRLVNSINSQTFKNWRILFIDGDSSKEHKNWLETCCSNNSKINYINQNKKYKDIYGAMNQGLAYIKESEYVLFWGSDDWAVSDDSLENMISFLYNYLKNNPINFPDLLIMNGIYIKSNSNKVVRIARFDSSKLFLRKYEYQRDLFFGSIPPHQATLFGPTAIKEIKGFDDNFKLTADLDFFLKLRFKRNLKVLISDQNLVFISDDGVSARNTKLRFKEVVKTYFRHYKYLFIIPFLMRYFKKIKTFNL